VLHSPKHILQLFDPETEMVSLFSKSPVIVNRATPTFGRRVLDRRIASLAFDLDDQVARILQLDHEIRQVFPRLPFGRG
jgi:hypothetical protein